MLYSHLGKANKHLDFVVKFDKEKVYHIPTLPNGKLIFPAGYNPPAVAGSEATHMRNEDCVIGVTVNGRHRAYPYWIGDKFHTINDTLSGEQILITC